MGTLGREELALRIFVLFSIITAITGAVNMMNDGTITIHDLGSGDYRQTIPGQASPMIYSPATTSMNGAAAITATTLDFTSTAGFNPNFTKVATSLFSGDTFTRSDGIGYESSYTPAQYPNLAELDIKGTTPSNGVYNVVYHVYNQFSDYPFYTYVSVAETGNGFVSGKMIEYSPEGISLVDSNSINTKIDTVNVLYSNEGYTYETVFDSTTGNVDVYIDNSFIATLSDSSLAGMGASSQSANPDVGVYNAGIAASHNALSVSQIDGNFALTQSQLQDPLTTIANFLWSLLLLGYQFLAMIGAILGLSQNALIPFWAWAIIGLPCIAALLIIYIEIARGV
jgi:hypothetical protein